MVMVINFKEAPNIQQGNRFTGSKVCSRVSLELLAPLSLLKRVELLRIDVSAFNYGTVHIFLSQIKLECSCVVL